MPDGFVAGGVLTQLFALFFLHLCNLLLQFVDAVLVRSRLVGLLQILRQILDVFLLFLQVRHLGLQRIQRRVQGFARPFQQRLNQTVVGIDNDVQLVAHLSVETHLRIDFGHFLHTPHIFGTRHEYRFRFLAHGLQLHMIHAAGLRQLRVEQAAHPLLFLGRPCQLLVVRFRNQPVGHVRIHAHKPPVAVFLLQEVDERRFQLTVHNQHVVALGLGRLYIGVLVVGRLRVKEHEFVVLVGLLLLDGGRIFLQAEILLVGILQQIEFLGAFGEFLVGKHPVLDKNLEVVPLLFEILALVLIQPLYAVGHLFGNVRRDFLDVAVALQIRTRHVERDVGRVDDAVQQRQVVGHDAFHRIGHINLVAVKLNLVFL